MASSKIEWTEATWNPTTGCTKISEGCRNCYAERMAKRLQAMGVKKYCNGFDITLHPYTFEEPYLWRTPRTVFVNSMSDLFHESIPFSYIKKVFKVMNENQMHTFQVLTKRSDILMEYSNHLNWTKNIWIGVTVENQSVVHRVDSLRNSNGCIKFLSIEPLLSEIRYLDLSNIDWVIVGGESGPKARPMREEWVYKIQTFCADEQVPFFFKQWGGTNKKKTGRLLSGKIWNEMPNTVWA
jgi:protein gp37